MLNAFERLQGALGRVSGLTLARARAHDAVKDKRDEADRSVGVNVLGQSVVDRLELQYFATALDVGQ